MTELDGGALDPFASPRSDERALALRYAPAAARAGLAALLLLDGRLGAILRTTREPLVGQMRLTWWHDALTALDTAPAPAEPVLQALARDVVPAVSGASLAIMIEGWEALLEPALDQAVLTLHADARGATLFRSMAALCGTQVTPGIAAAGRGWALGDLADHLRDGGAAPAARAQARTALEAALSPTWPVRARAIGALAHLARLDVADSPRPPGHPARAGRLLWHRMSGR